MKKYALRNPEVEIEVCQFQLEKDPILNCMSLSVPNYRFNDDMEELETKDIVTAVIIRGYFLALIDYKNVKVKPGDYVVKYKQGAVRIFSEEEFNETYIEIY